MILAASLAVIRGRADDRTTALPGLLSALLADAELPPAVRRAGRVARVLVRAPDSLAIGSIVGMSAMAAAAGSVPRAAVHGRGKGGGGGMEIAIRHSLQVCCIHTYVVMEAVWLGLIKPVYSTCGHRIGRDWSVACWP